MLLALGFLAGNSYLTNTSTKKAIDLSTLRSRQIDTVNMMHESYLSIMLAAMDSIVDKDEGKINDERMEIINKNADFIKNNLDNLEKLADTEEEKRLAKAVRVSFGKLADGIQKDLVGLIEKSGIRNNEIAAEFDKIDDVLDEWGDAVGENLKRLEATLQQKLSAAETGNTGYKEQIDIVNYMRLSHLKLMLAAMDSIVDKGEGKIQSERAEIISTEITYLQRNLERLEKTTETAQEKDLLKTVRAGVLQLDTGIQVNLKKLIEESAVEQQEIVAAFIKIDDVLDEYGDQMGEELQKIKVSVQEEMKEANQEMVEEVSGATVSGLSVFFISLVGLSIAFFYLIRSITKPITVISEILRESSDQITSASSQVASSSQSLAQGSSEQASSLEESSASLEEMSAMTKQNADNAGQAKNMMEESTGIWEK